MVDRAAKLSVPSFVDNLSDESMDALFEAGCDDATFGARDGAQYGEFDRAATSFSTALSSAIHDRAVEGNRG